MMWFMFLWCVLMMCDIIWCNSKHTISALEKVSKFCQKLTSLDLSSALVSENEMKSASDLMNSIYEKNEMNLRTLKLRAYVWDLMMCLWYYDVFCDLLMIHMMCFKLCFVIVWCVYDPYDVFYDPYDVFYDAFCDPYDDMMCPDWKNWCIWTNDILRPYEFTVIHALCCTCYI